MSSSNQRPIEEEEKDQPVNVVNRYRPDLSMVVEEQTSIDLEPDDNIVPEEGLDMTDVNLHLIINIQSCSYFSQKAKPVLKFKNVMLLIIIINSFLYIFNDYSDRIKHPNDATPGVIFTDPFVVDVFFVLKYFFAFIYVTEFLLRVISLGFIIGKRTFLRASIMNILDFIVATDSFIQILGLFGVQSPYSKDNFIPLLRIMRPIRALQYQKDMKRIFKTLLSSVPGISQVCLIWFLIVVVYSIIGVVLFQGAFEWRCRLTPKPVDGKWQIDPAAFNQLCGVESCPAGDYCGNPMEYGLPQNFTEVSNAEFFYGIYNFDIFYNATLFVFVTSTQEMYDDLMPFFWQHISPIIVNTYFVTLVIIGAFFMVNLFLAVLRSQYEKNDALIRKQEEVEQEQAQKSFLKQNNPNISLIQINKKEETKSLLVDGKIDEAILLKEEKKTDIKTPLLERPDEPDTIAEPRPEPQVSTCRTLVCKLTKSPPFIVGIMLLILANTVILAMDGYGITVQEMNMLDSLNNYLSDIFLVELLLKLYGQGFSFIKSNRFNQFDTFIVITCFALQFFKLQDTNGSTTIIDPAGDSTYMFAQILKTLRIFRIFRLARYWKGFINMMRYIVATLRGLKYYIYVFVLYLFIMSLVGSFLFAYKARFFNTENNEYPSMALNATSPFYNFDTFANASLANFKSLANGVWNNFMDPYLRGTNDDVTVLVFFIGNRLFGGWVLLGLLLAFLITTFHKKREEIDIQIKEEEQHGTQDPFSDEPLKFLADKFTDLAKRTQENIKKKALEAVTNLEKKPKKERKESDILDPELRERLMRASSEFQVEISGVKLVGRSLNFFTSIHPFRTRLTRIMRYRSVHFLINCLIVLNCILLAYDTPLTDPNQTSVKFAFIGVFIINVIFTIELFFRFIMHGVFFNGPDSYLRDKWGFVDLIVIGGNLFMTVLSLTTNLLDVYWLSKFVSMLKAGMALRLINRNDDLKTTLRGVIRAIPNVFHLIFAVSIYYIAVAILAVQLQKGVLHHCDFTNIPANLEVFVISSQNCMDFGGDWVPNYNTFDTFGDAMVMLIKLTAADYWDQTMQDAINAPGPGLQPYPYANFGAAIYYAIFVIFGYFLVLNLFSAIVVDSVMSQTQDVTMSEEQREWLEMQVAISQLNPLSGAVEPKNRIRAIFYKIAKSSYFDNFMVFVTVLNCIAGTLIAYREAEWIVEMVDIIMFCNQIFFTIEMVVKISALGHFYFKDFWCKFDFVVTNTAWISIIIEAIYSINLTKLVWSVRFSRFFTLFNRVKPLKVMLTTLYFTIPALINILLLLIVTMYVYAVIGMQLFALNKPYYQISDSVNFETLGSSFFTLFEVLTGSWSQLWVSFGHTIQPDYACLDLEVTFVDYQNNGFMNCGSPWAAALFFGSYWIFFSVVLLQFFLGVMIKRFDDESKEEQPILNTKHLFLVQSAWMEYDPEASGIISQALVYDFLNGLDPPMGFADDEEDELDEFIQNLKVYENKNTKDKEYFFHDVLLALSRRRIAKDKNIDIDKLEVKTSQLKEKKKKMLYRRGRQSVDKVEFKANLLKKKKVEPEIQLESKKEEDPGNDKSPTDITEERNEDEII